MDLHSRSRRFLRCALVLLIACAFSAPAFEAADAQSRQRRTNMSPQTGKKIMQANELIATGKAAEARKVLVALSKRRGLNSYEIALMYQLLGMIESEEKNYKKAAAYLRKAIKQDALPIAAQLNLEFTVGQFYMIEEEYEKARAVFRIWLEKVEREDSPVKPNAGNYYMYALSNMALEDVDGALEPAKKAVAMAASPRESWMRMLAQIYYLKGDFPNLAESLEDLLVAFPKKDYYTQLSGAYSELERNKEAIAVLQLAYQAGYIEKEAEIRNLAQMYLFHDIPYWGALVMEKGFEDEIVERDPKNLQLLADSLLIARETKRSIPPLKEAAEKSPDGKLYLRLGQAYLQDQEWQLAARAFQSGIDKGELDDVGDAYLLLGVARVNEKNYAAARRALNRAAKFETTKKTAGVYLNYIAAKEQRGL